MDKEKILEEIFNNDPLGLLNVKPKQSNARTAEERLLASFQEINEFVERNGRPPEATSSNVSEFQLYSRLKNLKKDKDKINILKQHDSYNLLLETIPDRVNESQTPYGTPKEINSIDDILNDDSMNILGDDSEGLFEFKHTPKDFERAEADFIARRKPCKDFDKYEPLFKQVHKELANGERKLIDFREVKLNEGYYYVHNGVLLFLEKINISIEEQSFPSGSREREDGRTKCIFENGTESNMLYRSLVKILYKNGRIVTENIKKVNQDFAETFGNVTDDDKEAGYIYVLKSKSKDPDIAAITNLFKIGYSKTKIEERVKNAKNEPAFLMAPVSIQGAWKCFNLNPQKLELLLHNFFGGSCLELDVFDEKGKRHTPREWFIAPLEVIEQAIELIISGKIINYKYDAKNLLIIMKN